MLQKQEYSVGFERYGRLIFAVQRSALTRNAKAVLMALIGLVDWHTWQRQLPTSWIARRVGISEDTVSRALPELLALKLILREEPSRSSPIWQVLPDAILMLEPMALSSKSGLVGPPSPDTQNTGSFWSLAGKGGVAAGAGGQGVLHGRQPANGLHAGTKQAQAAQPTPQPAASHRHTALAGPMDASSRGISAPRRAAPHTPPGESQGPQRADLFLQDPDRRASLKQASAPSDQISASRKAAESASSVSATTEDGRRFLAILKRWSGSEAPSGCAWQVRFAEDLDWYLREIAAVALKEGLNPLAILNGWDEFLELITRGLRECRFPVNFKNSLRNQLAMRLRLRPSTPTQTSTLDATSALPERPQNPVTRWNGTAFEGREPARPRYLTRDQWHTDEQGRRRTMSYREYAAAAQSGGGEVWSRERFDAHVRQNGLEPVA